MYYKSLKGQHCNEEKMTRAALRKYWGCSRVGHFVLVIKREWELAIFIRAFGSEKRRPYIPGYTSSTPSFMSHRNVVKYRLLNRHQRTSRSRQSKPRVYFPHSVALSPYLHRLFFFQPLVDCGAPQSSAARHTARSRVSENSNWH